MVEIPNVRGINKLLAYVFIVLDWEPPWTFLLLLEKWLTWVTVEGLNDFNRGFLHESWEYLAVLNDFCALEVCLALLEASCLSFDV